MPISSQLPLSFDIAWAAALLLALLHRGVKGIRPGPALPAFLTSCVAKVRIGKVDLKTTASAEKGTPTMMVGR